MDVVRDFVAPMLIIGAFVAVEVTCIGKAVRERDTREGFFWMCIAMIGAMVMAVALK